MSGFKKQCKSVYDDHHNNQYRCVLDKGHDTLHECRYTVESGIGVAKVYVTWDNPGSKRARRAR